MTSQSRSVVVRLSLDTAQAMRASKEFGSEIGRAMDDAEKGVHRTGAAIDDLGNKAGKVGAGAALALGLIGKAAMDWESQWAGVEKTVDGTASQMAVLEEELRGLATTLPATHEEIAGVAEAAGQLGVAREDITDFTKTMVDLGETTNLTAEEAATSIAQMANVLGTAGEDVDNLGSALVALGNDGASTEAQILGMAQRIAGAGAQIGLAESDILAIANAAASMGIEVEAGGSAISRVFTSLAKATAQGGEELDAFSEVAGMTASEFARAFEADPARAFASFTEGLNRINESGGDVFTTLDQLGLSDVRVSQALLGMAASGDLLTDSLDLGAEAWAENTALAEEAAKRYDTTASQVQVAWNQIKDAGIDAGAALLPMIAEVADVVGGMANAFGRLPEPVQSSVAGLLGITAVLGGGLWFTSKVIGGIESTRASLTSLSGSADRSSKAMKGVAVAGAALAALTIAAAGVRALGDAMQETLPGTEALTGRLLDLRDGKIGALGAEFDSLGESIRRVTDKSSSEAFGDAMQTPFEGLFGESGSLEEAKAEIAALDEALAGLAASAGPEAAAQAFIALAESGGLSATQLRDLGEMLPQYQEALAAAANQQRIGEEAAGGAAAATDEFAGSMDGAADAAKEEAKAIRDSIAAMEDKRDAALGAFDAETAYRKALVAARAAAAANTAGIKGNSEAALDNRAKLSDLAGAWNDLSNKAQNTPGRFKAARDAFIQTAQDMGVPREQARALARELLEIPNKVLTKTEVDPGNSHSVIQGVFDHLNRLPNQKTINVHTVFSSSGEADYVSGGRPRGADGMTVPGQREPYGDKLLAWVAPGEEIISNRHGQADQFRADRAAGRIPRYADGGEVGLFPRYAGGGEVGGNNRSLADKLEIAQMLLQIRQLKKSLAADGKDKLEGLNRKIAFLQLQTAEKELRLARNREEREKREAEREKLREQRERLREKREALRAAQQGLSFDSIVPDQTPVTVAMQVADEIEEYKQSILDAGGKWTKALEEWAQGLIATANQIDQLKGRLAEETAKRDALVDTLAEQQRALDQLNSTMASYAASVEGNFLSDPFNQSYTRPRSADPATAAALASAQAQLAAIRNSADGDSVTAAAQASRLLQQIAALQASIEASAGEETVTGLAALEAILTEDIEAAQDMAAALATLAGKGLDTTGPLGGLYQELAASGDLETAEQLASLTEAEIAQYEALYAARAEAAATVAAQATQAVYGEQQAQLEAAIAETTKAINQSAWVIAALNYQLTLLGGDVRAGAEAGAELLKPQLQAIKTAIDTLPRELRQLLRQDKGK